MERIVICVCTFKRAKLLKECLESITKITLPSSAEVHMLVVDNDPEQASHEFTQSLNDSFPIPLHYVCEPRQGIPCARNKAIEVAHQLDADYFVFIDDDERVEPDWLVQLVGYCRSKGGQAVIHGGVEQELPVGTPAHIQAVYQRKKRKTGDSLNACATNNVIVPIRVTRDLGLRFDESNPLAGGTDTIFFTEARAKGVQIFECSEAQVKETIPASRATLAWMLKRKYRAGITEAWRKQQSGRSKTSILISALLQALLESLKAVLMTVVGNKVSRNRFWLKASRSAGVFAGVFGVEVDSYKKIDN